MNLTLRSVLSPSRFYSPVPGQQQTASQGLSQWRDGGAGGVDSSALIEFWSRWCSRLEGRKHRDFCDAMPSRVGFFARGFVSVNAHFSDSPHDEMDRMFVLGRKSNNNNIVQVSRKSSSLFCQNDGLIPAVNFGCAPNGASNGVVATSMGRIQVASTIVGKSVVACYGSGGYRAVFSGFAACHGVCCCRARQKLQPVAHSRMAWSRCLLRSA